jgi:hypothetical protein
MHYRKLLWLSFALILVAVAIPTPQAQAQSSYTYILHGPYYEDNTVAPDATNVTVYWINGAVVSYLLQASGGVADTQTITSINPITSLSWNVTSSSSNATRIYDITSTTATDINIYVTNADLASALYSFSVTDYAGMTAPFIQTQTSSDGLTWYTVESRSLNESASISFLLTQYNRYQVIVTCTEGTYTQPFIPEATYTHNIAILTGTFSSSSSVSSPTFTASRTTSSNIYITYTDPSTSTQWLSLNITHKSGTSTITDYVLNQTGNTQIIEWNGADSDKSYTVAATASVGGDEQSWSIPLVTSTASNPFLGMFDFLGVTTATLPGVYTGWPPGMTSFQIAQLVAALLITVFLGMGSFRNAGASAIMACIFAGIMFAIGWWSGGVGQASVNAVPMLGLAFFIAIFTHFNEKKSEGAGLS